MYGSCCCAHAPLSTLDAPAGAAAELAAVANGIATGAANGAPNGELPGAAAAAWSLGAILFLALVRRRRDEE